MNEDLIIKKWSTKHFHKIWRAVNGKWCTYVFDKNKDKNRRFVSRKTIEKLDDYLTKYYNGTLITKTDKKILQELKEDFSKYKEVKIWDIKLAHYLVSPMGDLYSIIKKKWMKQTIYGKTKTYKGQKYVMLVTNNNEEKRFSVARITLGTFVGLPPQDMEDPTVDHIDLDPLNNYYKNLRWIERGANSSTRGNRGIGEQNSRAILTQEDVKHICNLLVKNKKTISEIASIYNVSEITIQNIKDKKTWKYITAWFEF